MTPPVRAGALALFGAVLLAVAGCGPSPKVESMPTATDSAAAVAPAYRLRAGDSVHIGFVTDRSMSLDTPITPAGTVTVPLAGDVQAAGKTVEELASDIEGLMKPYLLDPSVAVVMVGIAPQPIFVIGEVARPGRVDSAGTLTVSRAVASVGGLLPTAKAGSVMVVRTEGVEEPTAYKIDLASALSAKDLTQDMALLPNDVVYVPRSVIGDIGGFVTLFFDRIIPAQLFYLHGYDMAHAKDRGWWQ